MGKTPAKAGAGKMAIVYRVRNELLLSGLQPVIRSSPRAELSTIRWAKRLLAGGFRNRLILHTFDKVASAAVRSALFKRRLPTGRRALQDRCLFATRISHTSYSPPLVTACTPHAESFRATMHAGGDLAVAPR